MFLILSLTKVWCLPAMFMASDIVHALCPKGLVAVEIVVFVPPALAQFRSNVNREGEKEE